MIEYGELFKNVIPLEILGRFPLRFVHVLRDIRVKQKEEMARRMNSGRSAAVPNSVNSTTPIQNFDMSAMEEFIEENT